MPTAEEHSRPARRNRRVVLRATPEGPVRTHHFEVTEAEMPAPGPGEVLCRNVLASVDPVNRTRMQGASYRGAIRPGDVMDAFTLSEVVRVGDGVDGLRAGAVVAGDGGWQEHAVLPAAEVSVVEAQGPLTHHMSVLGVTGMTAAVGLLDIGRPSAGETLVVSAAGGGTGNVVGQIARLLGCRVVGIVGSAEKARVLEDDLGFDATVDHRAPDLRGQLAAAAPSGIDVYFDSVGGDVLNACLGRMNLRGRVVCCGVLSQYDAAVPPPGPRGVPGLVVSRRLRMEGFVVLDHAARFPELRRRLTGWIDDGRLRVLEEVSDGLESAPQAFVDVLAGRNLGKRMVRIGPDPAGPGGA